MSNSSLVNVKVPAYSGNYTKGRSGKKISEITIHHMAGVLTAEQCGKIFQRKGRNGSSHYGIGNDGRIGLYVDEKNTAWTNSNWEANCRAVTIETSNSKTGGDWPVSDKALDSLIKLVADIAKRNNIILVKGKTLTWHRMYSKTTCPGNYLLSKMDYIIEKANEINNPKVIKKSIEEIAKEVLAGKWGNGTKRKSALIKAGYDYNEVQAKVKELLKTNSKPTVSYYPKCTSSHTSIVSALNSIKVKSSFANRIKIANKNGIKIYFGTASQNTKLLALLKAGKLVKI